MKIEYIPHLSKTGTKIAEKTVAILLNDFVEYEERKKEKKKKTIVFYKNKKCILTCFSLGFPDASYYYSIFMINLTWHF